MVLRKLNPLIDINSFALELTQKYELINFNLGNTLYSSITSWENNPNEYLYWVYKGDIRLVSFDTHRQRDVSTGILTPGDIFGAESFWNHPYFSYQAIAKNKGQVIRIPFNELQSLFSKYPELANHWKNNTIKQQMLIFFKTSTELRNEIANRLEQVLPYFKLQQIKAGEWLEKVTPLESGRFWLYHGEIENTTNSSTPLVIGTSWGYYQDIPLKWQAKTNLLVYQLPKENWQKVTDLIFSLPEPRNKSKKKENKENQSIVAHFPTIKNITTIDITTQPIATPENPPTSIDFPKPLKRQYWFWENYPFIEQQSSSDCGAACLAMITQYWGKRLTINYLRNILGIGRSGSSLKNLAKGAESLGYLASPVRASFNRIAEQKNPWIAHWQGDHYVVVYKIKNNKVLIADPGRGKFNISRENFVENWTGEALLLDPTTKLNEIENTKPSLNRFITTLSNYKSLGLQIIVISLLIQILGLVSPLFTQIIFDKVVVNKIQLTLNVFIIGALICAIWQIILSAVRQYLLSYLSNRLNLTMISGFIKHTLSLPLKFFESRRVGDILTRVQENDKIQRFLVKQVLLAWLDFLTGFIYLGLMLYYNWQLTLLILGLIPPILILTLIATPFLRTVSKEIFNTSAEQNSSLVEMLNGIFTIKSAAVEADLRWRWEEHLTEQLNKQFKGQKLGINLEFAGGLINSVGGLIILWFGASLVIQDQLTIGQLVAFNMMKGYVISPVISLVNLWDELQQVLISIEKLNDVFDSKPEEIPGQPMLNLPRLKGEIQLENVTFRYGNEEQSNTLENINLSINPGETIAIVGRSGSGKSTLIKLLQGLYQPVSGKILFDGQDIAHISPASLRSQLGIVPQECFLFSGTILDNITLYRPEYSLEEVIKVAKLAQAHGFIQAMPLGYNTKVGERGANLSGGQRQRIAIARALLGEPSILVLDEATSSLDTESERRFQQNLALLSKNRTILIIAHRLSTVRNADLIIVLDQGVIIEQGNHEQLIQKQGIYYYLAQQQLDL